MRCSLDFWLVILKSAWWNNYFNTGDAVVYHPDGKVKIILDASIMRGVNSESPLFMGRLELGTDRNESVACYDALDGQEFSRKKLGKVSKRLNIYQVKKHPVWKALAGGDQSLLQEYVDVAFKIYKINSRMGVYFSDSDNGDKRKIAFGNLWFLNDNSYAIGCYGFNHNYGRLVGVYTRQSHSLEEMISK